MAVNVANELKNLVDRINRVIREEKTKRVALSSALAIQKQRIFVKGQDNTGSKIGNYSTDPISISRKNQARQTGKTYFKGGYAEYKTAIGKNNGFVNLRNTDQMMMDYQVIVNGDQSGLGFQNNFNADKSGWMMDKYDKNIFHLSDSEINVVTDTILSEIDKAL